MKRFGLIICGLLLATAGSGAEIKPTLTLEQGQMLINLMNQEIKENCTKGNCLAAAKPLGPIIEEIVRAANIPPARPVPPEEAKPPSPEIPPAMESKEKLKESDSDGKDN